MDVPPLRQAQLSSCPTRSKRKKCVKNAMGLKKAYSAPETAFSWSSPLLFMLDFAFKKGMDGVAWSQLRSILHAALSTGICLVQLQVGATRMILPQMPRHADNVAVFALWCGTPNFFYGK